MKKVFSFILFFCLSLSCSLFVQDKDTVSNSGYTCFTIYGEDHFIGISLPDYWTVDMDFAHEHNFNGFFYIKDQSINPEAFIILGLYEKRDDPTFDDFINYMVTSLRDYQPDYSVEKIATEKYSSRMNNWNLSLYELKKKSGHGVYENIAYMECENKYYLEMYISFSDDTVSTKEKYLKDFIKSIHEIEYLNAKVEEK